MCLGMEKASLFRYNFNNHKEINRRSLLKPYGHE